MGDGPLRTVAIVFLALFGLTLLVPPAAERIQLRPAFLQRLAPRRDADGFWSGLPVGGALGLVYAPCAGRSSPPYPVDARRGRVRYAHIGEGDYEQARRRSAPCSRMTATARWAAPRDRAGRLRTPATARRRRRTWEAPARADSPRPARPTARATRRRRSGRPAAERLQPRRALARRSRVGARGARCDDSLVKLDTLGEHVLTLHLDRGVGGFAFTFG